MEKNVVNLKKHNSVNLKKAAPNLVRVGLGLGWTSPKGIKVDLDLSVFPVNATGFCNSEDFLFYGVQDDAVTGMKHTMNKALTHTGDDETGDSSTDGDDETVIIELTKLNQSIVKLVAVATVHEKISTGMKFSAANDAYIRVYDADTQEELTRYAFEKENTNATALEFISLDKDATGNWHVVAIGEGCNDGLAGLCAKFKIGVE